MSPRSSRTVLARHLTGDREVRAVATPVPGLVVNEDAKNPGRWMVTHEPSGYALADMPDPEGALHAALSLGAVADWARSGRELLDDATVMPAWREWAAENCPWIFRHSPGHGRGL